MAKESVSLVTVKPGSTVTLTVIKAGKGLNRRLADMGLVPGATLRVINNQKSGPILVEVKGYRLALGHGVAQQVMVEMEG